MVARIVSGNVRRAPALPCSWRASRGTFRRSWSGTSDTSEWPLGTARSSFGHAHHSDCRTRLGWELAQTRKSLDEVREALRELQAAVLARARKRKPSLPRSTASAPSHEHEQPSATRQHRCNDAASEPEAHDRVSKQPAFCPPCSSRLHARVFVVS